MNLCKHCKKELKQAEGKRSKEFCDSGCRSNFWYGKNKKGKSDKKRGRKPKAYKPFSPENRGAQIPAVAKQVPKNEAKPASFSEWKEYAKTRTWEEMRPDLQNSSLAPNQKSALYEICKK